jgi:myosin protein heavy chain
MEYWTDRWLEKNKDMLNDNLMQVLVASSEWYISTLFAEFGNAPKCQLDLVGNVLGKKHTMKKGAFRMVAQRHKNNCQVSWHSYRLHSHIS